MFKPIFIGVGMLSILISLAHADTDPMKAIDSYMQQGASVKSIRPIFSQLLVSSFPQGFKPVFENTHDIQYIH